MARRADPSAVYICGENGETVSCPDVDFGFFDLILEKGSTDAVFVGHDHYNNLAVNYKGVDLVYSRSIDYIAYPGIAGRTAQRGGTLITLTPDGGYTLASVPYVPAEWRGRVGSGKGSSRRRTGAAPQTIQVPDAIFQALFSPSG